MDIEDLILAIAAGAAVFVVGKAMRRGAVASGSGGYVIPGSGVTNPVTGNASRPWLSGAPVSALASLFNGGSSASTNPGGAWMGGAPVSQYGGAGDTSPDTVYEWGGESGGAEWV